MLIIDTFFRYSGVGLLFLLAVATVRDMRATKGAIYLILSCISVAALFLGYTPEFLKLPKTAYILVRLLDIPHLVFIWLFALSLFQEQFRLTVFHILIGIVYSTPILLVRIAGFSGRGSLPFWVLIISTVTTLALMAHLIYSTLIERSADLRNDRRTSRVYFVIVIAFIAISAASIELLLTGENKVYLPTAKIITIWPAIVWTCYWLLSATPEALEFSSKSKQNLPLEMSARDKELVMALKNEMIGNSAFLEAKLSITNLARRLAVTPHRLRKIINHQLKYQNFNVFLNDYRIDAIKEAFADPKNEHIPILSIVLANGFNSLSPFNKAFRAKEGITPSAYRKSLNR